MYRPALVSDHTIRFRFARLLVALVVAGTFTVSCGDTERATAGPPTSAATSSSVAASSTSTTPTTVATTTTRPELTTSTTTDKTTTTLPPETTTTTTTTAVLEYSVDRAVDYIGTSATPYTIGSFQEFGGDKFFVNWYGPQADDRSWTLNVLRRYPGPDQDLVLLIEEDSNTVIDALLLTGDSAGRDLSIGLACKGSHPAILVDRNVNPVRAWKVTEDPLALTEVDVGELTAEEIESACANLPYCFYALRTAPNRP